MPVYRRNEGYIGLGKQASKGTGVAPSKFVKWDGATSLTPKLEFTVRREGGDGLYNALSYVTAHKADGQFALLCRPDIMAALLAWALGADSVSGAADPYTHTITPAASVPWLSIERQLASIADCERLVDCVIESLVIEGKGGLPLKATVGFLGIRGTHGIAAASATYEADRPYMFFDAAFQVNGSAVATVTEFRLAIKNLFEADLYTTEVYRADLPLIGRDVEVEFGFPMENLNQYREVLYGTSTGTALAETLKTGSFEIDANFTGAAARQMKLVVTNLVHVESPLEHDSEAGIFRYSCKAQALKGASDLVTVTAKTAASAAYV